VRKQALLFAATVACAFADQPIVINPLLPTPLVLPAGLVETLPLNHTASFFGNALRAVDCADAADQQYGICGNQFFGGIAMDDSHLSGNITIQFSAPVGNISHFIVYQGLLHGDDAVMAAPLGYSVPVRNASVSDALMISSGDLDLTTGVAANVNWYSIFSDSTLADFAKVNPNLALPVINFPGARGHANATFAQRPDGLLDFYFRGSTFLPLGGSVQGQSIRTPLPFCGPSNNCASVVSRGTSLHPHLYLETRSSLGYPVCDPNCPVFQPNHQSVFQAHTAYTAFGDTFGLDIPQLYCPAGVTDPSSSCAVNGSATGSAELQGRFQIQFGPQEGSTLPFVISTLRPTGLFADPPVSPLLGPGFQPGLLGTNELLKFPDYTYFQYKISFSDEPLNFAQGAIDLSTGRVIGEFEYPMYIDQAIIEAIFTENNGKVSTDPFFVMAHRPLPGAAETEYALFENGQNGQTTFRFNGLHRRSFAGYLFPNPDLIASHGWLGGPTSNLDIFTRMQGGRLNTPPSNIVKTAGGTFTSSLGDTVSYNFSIPCNPSGQPASFVYRNNADGPNTPLTTNGNARGGTFTLVALASASCTNSHVSMANAGDYDIVNFTGFGKWSADPDGSLYRFVSVSASVSQANPYASIIVFRYQPTSGSSQPEYDLDVELSSAENKPPTVPVP
jgi:hypothetical protein